MRSKKCDSCGFVLWADALSCKRCGSSFTPQEKTADAPVSTAEVVCSFTENSERGSVGKGSITKPKRRLAWPAFGALGLGLLCSGAYSLIGAPAYFIAALLFVAGLVLSAMALVRIKRGTEHGPKWGALVGAVGNGGLLVFHAVVLPLLLVLIPAGGKPSWREYVSTSGRFTIQLPATPLESSRNLSDQTGVVPMYSTEARLGNGVCTSFYYDYSNFTPATSEEALLNAFVERAVANSEGTLLNKKSITFEGNNGFELETKPNPDKYGRNMMSTARIIWVADRSSLYMNLVTGPANSALFQERYKFLDSFKLTTGQEMQAKFSVMHGSTPLIDAAAAGNDSRVRSLLSEGHATSKEKDTALMRAVRARKLLPAVALIQAGANVNTIEPSTSRTLLMLATLYCDGCVRPLIDVGADVNAQEPQHGWTALMLSLINNHGLSVETLVSAKANLNLRDKDGETALMHAVGPSQYQKHLKALLAGGADVNLRDNEGKTALTKALRHQSLNPGSAENAEVVALLRGAGGLE